MKDDDLGLKVALPIVIILLLILFILVLMKWRENEITSGGKRAADYEMGNNRAYDQKE